MSPRALSHPALDIPLTSCSADPRPHLPVAPDLVNQKAIKLAAPIVLHKISSMNALRSAISLASISGLRSYACQEALYLYGET